MNTMELEGLKKALVAEAESLKDKLFKMSDAFYNDPETGLNEHNTSTTMKNALRGARYVVEEAVGGITTDFRATLGSGSPKIALLAEMDALPGIGHACGHNISGTATVGAAIALSEILPETGFNGTVIVLGTPAEELGKGKIEMIEAGVFKDIDAAMMVHASSTRKAFKHFLGLVRLNFVFNGRSSHAAAYPEEGINALDGVIQTFNAIGALRQQLRQDVRIHGIITDGGKAPNIIPARAAASFYVRAADLKQLNAVKVKVVDCARAAALATGTTVDITESKDFNAPMKKSDAFLDCYRNTLKYLNLKEDETDPYKNVGSSDIGNVSQIIPTIHPYVPIRPGINIHTVEFAEATATDDGHRAIIEGVKCLGITALELLFNPETLSNIKKEFVSANSGL